MEVKNEMQLEFRAISDNEAFARTAVAAFVAQLNPTLEEISDIKTAVSEAVTNSIIHGYENLYGYGRPGREAGVCSEETGPARPGRRANPGKVKVATVGRLTGDHLFLMQIEKLTGAKFTQVPYSGSGKAIPALLSGEVDAYFGSGSSFLRMEKTRGLAVGSRERYELCPDVPTFIEQGYDIESGKYRGLATPRNIPAEARQYLETRFAELCANPEYQKAVKSSGLTPFFQTGKDFGETIRTQGKQAEKLLEASGLLK